MLLLQNRRQLLERAIASVSNDSRIISSHMLTMKNCQFQSQRTYIFVPSWDEICQTIKKTFQKNNNARPQTKTLMIQLLNRKEQLIARLRLSQKLRKERAFLIWKTTKRQRIIRDRVAIMKSKRKAIYTNIKKQARIRMNLDQIRRNSRKLWNALKKISTSHSKSTKHMRNWSNICKKKLVDTKHRFHSSFHPITLTEPFHREWFDEDGYPLTSRDCISNRFVNPWNSESTNGWKKLADVWKWKRTRFGLGNSFDLLGNNVKYKNSNRNDYNDVINRFNTKESGRINQTDGLECSNDQMYSEKGARSFSGAISPPSSPDKIKLTWIGHATTLVQMSSYTILTDPQFSHKASPFQFWKELEFFGVPRYLPPSHSLEELPEVIDLCLISHDHYDHLDYDSIQSLIELKKVSYFVVPSGLKEWLVDTGVKKECVIELEWWEGVKFKKTKPDLDIEVVALTGARDDIRGQDVLRGHNEIHITATPAQHWSSRTPFDRNKRLWCSWAIHASVTESNLHDSLVKKRSGVTKIGFFFAGDTGRPKIFPLHRLIGDRLGPFDLAAIPIGAYSPRFFMNDSHCDPYEALQIHKDLKSKRSIAIHWGTFPLANEPLLEPPQLLYEAVYKYNDHLQKNGVNDEYVDFVAIAHGLSLECKGEEGSAHKAIQK